MLVDDVSCFTRVNVENTSDVSLSMVRMEHQRLNLLLSNQSKLKTDMLCICSQTVILTVISRKSGRWRAHLTIWYSLCSVMCNMELNLCLSQSVSLSRQHGIGSSVFSSYNDSRPSMSWKQITHNHDQNNKFAWVIWNWTRWNLMVLYATCLYILVYYQ